MEEVFDGDDRAMFLPSYDDGRRQDVYLLYFWELLRQTGLVQFTLAKLPSWIKSNNQTFALVFADRTRSGRNRDDARMEIAKSIKVVGKAIQTQATESTARNVAALERQLFDVELKMADLTEGTRPYEVCLKRKSSLELDIAEAKKRMPPS